MIARRNTIQIQNLFCGKCAAELKDKLLQIKNISNVFVHQDQAHISFNYKKARDLSNLENMLTSLGFPPMGEKIMSIDEEGLFCKDLANNYCLAS